MNDIRFFLFILLVSTIAHAHPKVNANDFLEQAKRHHRAIPHINAPDLKVGETAYLPISALIRGQNRLSVDNMLMKLDERFKDGDVINGVPQHDGGRSSVPLIDPISVIKLSTGYVITDGHHDAYLALYLGATTIPVIVEADYTDLSPREAWLKLRKKNQILLAESIDQLEQTNPDFETIRDEPNRYLAGLLALKAKVKRHDDGHVDVFSAKGGQKPVWIKMNGGVPFIEFYIADILNAAGIRYRPKWGKDIPDKVVEAARQALMNAARKREHKAFVETPIIANAEAGKKMSSDLSLLSIKLSKFSKSAKCSALFTAE